MPISIRKPDMFGKPTLRYANNGKASWSKVNNLSQWQKGTGWQSNLYGGVQTGDDWAAFFVPVMELPVSEFNEALWSYYMTGAQTMGVNIVIWIHDPTDFSKRAEVTQSGNAAGLGKSAGWNSHNFNPATTQMIYYGENTTGSGLTAGTQYAWTSFQADAVFKNWTIYRISLEYGWEASGTFDNVWLAECVLQNVPIPIIPGENEVAWTGSVYAKADTATGDTARRFETSSKKLSWAAIQVTTKAQLFGDSGSQPVSYAADATFELKNVDISTLYFKNATAGQNGTVSIVGILAE
jgi:hypothetical protein